MFSAVRRSPTKPKDVVTNTEKKSELEKRLENVQNVPSANQTAKKPKPGRFFVDLRCVSERWTF